MRMFGLVALVGVLLIVGILVKKQSLGPQTVGFPANGGSVSAPASDSSASTARVQSQQLQQDIQQSLDAAMRQQRRTVPEDQ